MSITQDSGTPAGANTEAPVEVITELPTGAVFDVADWLPEALVPIWDTMALYPMLLTVSLIAAGFIVSKIVQWLFSHVLARITRKTKTDLDDRLISLLSKPVFSTVFLLTLMLVVAALALPPAWSGAFIRILLTLIVFSWTRAGLRTIRLVLELMGKVKHHFEILEERTIPLFDIIFKLLLVGVSAYILFMLWGIDATAWLASAGVIGLAVGFAAKDSLANLFSGFFIVADAPYKIGDFIVLDTGERGQVTQVGMRSTRLLSRDDIEITIPNAVIANAKIINESGGPWEKERIRIKVGVAYGSDLEQVSEVLLEIARSDEHIVNSPEPRVRLRAFGPSSVDFELLCWIDEPVLRGRLSHQVYMKVYKRFGEAGIEIPYQKVDLYLKESPTVTKD
jgi:MscS family membrane protein